MNIAEPKTQQPKITGQTFYMLIHPNGKPILRTVATDEATCRGWIDLMHKKKLNESVAQYLFKGYKIRPVHFPMLEVGGSDAFGKQEESQ